MAVLGSQSLIVLMVSVDVKQNWTRTEFTRAQEMCESWGGRPGFSVANSPYLCSLGSPSLIVLIVSVGVKQHPTTMLSAKSSPKNTQGRLAKNITFNTSYTPPLHKYTPPPDTWMLQFTQQTQYIDTKTWILTPFWKRYSFDRTQRFSSSRTKPSRGRQN